MFIYCHYLISHRIHRKVIVIYILIVYYLQNLDLILYIVDVFTPNLFTCRDFMIFYLFSFQSWLKLEAVPPQK